MTFAGFWCGTRVTETCPRQPAFQLFRGLQIFRGHPLFSRPGKGGWVCACGFHINLSLPSFNLLKPAIIQSIIHKQSRCRSRSRNRNGKPRQMGGATHPWEILCSVEVRSFGKLRPAGCGYVLGELATRTEQCQMGLQDFGGLVKRNRLGKLCFNLLFIDL